MSKVVGGVAVGALATVSGAARAWQQPTGITDADTGSNSDNPGYGRGGRGSGLARPNTGYTDNDGRDPVNGGRSPETGITDQDSGAQADDAGRGRGRLGRPGVRQGGRVGPGPTDNDRTDVTGEGRGRYTGLSDQDTGSRSDNAGYGRGGAGSHPDPQVGRGRVSTGITDQDSGSNSDEAGYGRGGAGSRPGRSGPPGCSDNDPYPNADPGGAGRHC